MTNTFGNVNVKGDPVLFFSDGSTAPFMFDDGGNYKLLCGSISGRIFLYDNIDGNLTGNFNRIDTNVNRINDGPRSALQYMDVNGDGIRDLLVGNYGGGLSFYSSKAPIGINELSSNENSIILFPNPADDIIQIHSKYDHAGKMKIQVIDVLGKNIAQYSSPSAYLQMDCGDWQPGVYFLRIEVVVNKQSFFSVKKVVIQ
jgi:hypothetical protein